MIVLPGRVLVIGDSIRLVSKAKSAGIDVVYIQKPSQFDPALIPHCQQLALVDYQHVPSAAAMAAALHRIAPITRIVTQTEAAQLVAGHLTDTLGIPGTSERCARLLHDKSAMRALLNEQGIGPVPYAVNPTHAQLREFVVSHGAAIVKPTKGSGSLGVRRIESVEDVDEVWAWCQSFELGEFQVEKHLVGPELSVEAFSESGRHTIIAVTAKDTDGGTVELGHVIPAPLAEDQLDQIRELTVRLLDAVGLEDGPSHTEIILTAEGPRVVESHTRRGGDRINDLVRMVYGVDMEEATYRLVGEGAPLDGHLHPARGAAAIRFLTAAPGVVTSVTGLDAARAVDGVVEVSVSVEAGSVVPELRWSDDRCGHVIVRADDADTAARLARTVAGHISINTEPVTGDCPDPDASEPDTLSSVLRPYDEVFDPFHGAVTAP
ncbi:ATP-grasp domain-containing protein [Streptomyces lomondensis]|nr:ATP-grasp domain-containing protein [Streptomyces lomondensis]MCF0077004.1 ATP-grasp domain-containing protein [Streptomyces lomondensis]